MPRPTWNGSRVTKAIRWLHRSHPPCWLCHHPIPLAARSIDHELTVASHPELEWQPSNWRPAHLYAAGHPRGCPTPNCTCPGNNGRGTRPHTSIPTRNW